MSSEVTACFTVDEEYPVYYLVPDGRYTDVNMPVTREWLDEFERISSRFWEMNREIKEYESRNPI